MAKRLFITRLIAAGHRLAGRPSLMLLTASDEQLNGQPPQRFVNAWPGLMALSLGLGVLLAVLWGLAWQLFKEPANILFTPVAVTVAVFVLWPFRRGMAALAEIIAGPQLTNRAVASALLVAVLTLCLLGLGGGRYHSEKVLPDFLAWARPSAELYRVLILMPLWGGWAMLITGQFCRANQATEPAVVAFTQGCGPLAATACMLPPALLTWAYFHFLGGWEISMSAVTIFAAIGGGVVLSRRAGGLRHSALLAANVLTQLVFVLTYLANR
jgi:hypothetical protein